MCSYQDEIKYCEHVCCASQDNVQPVEKGAEDTLPMGTRKLAPHNSPIPALLNKISNLICWNSSKEKKYRKKAVIRF